MNESEPSTPREIKLSPAPKCSCHGEGTCIACLIWLLIGEQYGSGGLIYLRGLAEQPPSERGITDHQAPGESAGVVPLSTDTSGMERSKPHGASLKHGTHGVAGAVTGNEQFDKQETPRTDAHLAHLNLPDGYKVGLPTETVDLLRQLEREFAGANDMMAYNVLRERCNELLRSLQAIRDSESESHQWCREVATHTVDGDEILWGQPAELTALAILRELNDALAIPGWMQPRVDALLDRAEGEPMEPAIRPTEEAANAFWRYWERNGITHVHGYYESTWGAINAALRTSGIVQHRYGSTLKEMLDSGHPPQHSKE